MKVGFGLYHHMLTEEHFKFARQAGATHIVAHLTDYFNKGDENNTTDQPVGTISKGWGYVKETEVWSRDMLVSLKKDMAEFDLKLEALENISPAFWHDILLDGPDRDKQIEDVKQLIRNMGEAGIPILGYNFSLAGVAGRTKEAFARGGALAVGMKGDSEALHEPIPKGMVWNMIYDSSLGEETIPTISHAELMRRYQNFLEEVLPVAEEAGVKLALHPDDPPLEEVRNQPRLGHHPDHYKEVMDLYSSSHHVMELCLGTMAEMDGSNIYEAVKNFASKNKIGYIHFRNVKGNVPDYQETFVDEGDIDMPTILEILKENNYQGILIPDHTPLMSCDAPWYAGMAYAMGYIKGLIQVLNK